MQFIYFREKLRWRGSCEFAMLSLCTDSATELATICSIVEIFTCIYSRMMKSSNPALVPASAFLSTCSRREFENNVGIYFFIFCGRPGISNLWRVTRAWPRRCHLRNQSFRRFCQPSGIECVHVHKRHNFIPIGFISLVTCCAMIRRYLLFYWMRAELRHALSSIAIFKQIETF